MILSFDKESHEYRRGDTVIPGVTSILKQAGFSYAYYRSEEAAAFGTVGHDIVRLLLAGKLGSYDAAFEPWMVGIRAFIQNENPVPYLSPEAGLERIFYNDLGFMGTWDFCGSVNRWRGKEGILDWKFWGSKSSLALATAGLQTSAYADTAKKLFMLSGTVKRGVVHFFQDGYRIYDCNDSTDFNYFNSALNCYKWREKHNQLKDAA